jgi:hypothetical protein
MSDAKWHGMTNNVAINLSKSDSFVYLVYYQR